MPKLQTVHVRVNDAATGKPTPCRVRFTDAVGNYYAPFGRLVTFATSPGQDAGGNVKSDGKAFAYIDGACEINLPAGRLHVEVHKGPEYSPLVQDFELAVGKLSIRLQIQRWIDLPKIGWYSGDARAHFLSPHAALLEAQAEDVHVVNLLAMETELPGPVAAISNILDFSGQEPLVEKPGYLVAVNSLNTHPLLGSLALLHCHRVVYPLTFGGPQGSDDWTLADWCDQCHRKNGLVVWTDTGHSGKAFHFGEPLADVILGKIDAFEISGAQSPFDVLPIWHKLLNAGIRLPLVGAGGKESNASVLGSVRTFAHLEPEKEFTYRNWIEAIRAGRSFVSNGPLFLVTVNNEPPGATIELQEPGEKVRIKVVSSYEGSAPDVELIFNEVVIGRVSSAEIGEDPTTELEVECHESGWFFARCAAAGAFAISSPIYVHIKDRPRPRKPWEIQVVVTELERMELWAREKARCPTPAQRERLANIFLAAKEKLLSPR